MFCITIISAICIPTNAKGIDVKHVSLSDTNRYGIFSIHNYKGWTFSFISPDKIEDKRNLIDTISVKTLVDISSLKKLPNWNKYGWFEQEFDVDSTLRGVPLILSYRSQEAIKVWLNGKLILEAGNPSINPENEVLSRFINAKEVGIVLREGRNYLLMEYSSHGIRPIHDSKRYYENGLFLVLLQQYEPFQRRERGFIFGGAVLLLFNLVLIHLFLAYRFKGTYHIYVAFSTFFMLLHSFSTMSDTLIDWTVDYSYFANYTFALSYILVLYFYLIAIRKFYELPVRWTIMNVVLGISLVIGSIIVNVDYDLLNYLHQPLIFASFAYGSFTLIQAWEKHKESSVVIIAGGLVFTLLGTFLYIGVYLLLGYQIDWLFYTSVLLSYTSIPISLTLIVASSYARLISTLEEKVIDRTAKLEAANEFQKRFFANVSHEFRTPLTISEGLISRVLGQGEYNTENTRYDLWLAKRNMVRLHDMVDQIIELTKADHHELILNRKNIVANELAILCVESFRSLAEYHGHFYSFNPINPSGEKFAIYADQANTEIMINNLISNAIKFTPDGGEIEVKTWLNSDTFHLAVADSGVGIAAEEREAIFERFHRITQADQNYVEGMGVGLELSRTLARLHGGDIVVYQNFKQGSVFELTLPLSSRLDLPIHTIDGNYEDFVRVEHKKVLSAEQNFNFKVLLVEDNEDLMHYTSSILSSVGTIYKAKNGKDALAKLATFTPDIIITDLMMPEMGGIELIQILSADKRWKDIPIVVLTARALEEEKTNVLRIGVVDYITKPFAPEQLVLKTKNLLSYYQTRKTLQSAALADDFELVESLSEKTILFIKENIKDTNLSVDSLAATFAMSRSTFYRSLEMQVGMTPAEFIREVRLTTARSIAATDKTIRLEVLANAVGYKSATSFRRMYQDRFGEHPLH